MSEPREAQTRRLADTQPSSGWRNRDHTRGSIIRSLLILSLPLMATSAAGVVYQLTDLTFLSKLGKAQMASVIIVNQTVRQVVMMAAMGLCFGTQALIARAVGEGDIDRAERLAGQAVVIGLSFATLVAISGLLLADPLFSLSAPDESFYQYGVPYLKLVLALSYGLIFMQLFGAILGGAGDTTTPLLVMIFQVTLAIAGEWIFMFGHFGMPALGVKGVAVGMAIGQGVGIVIGVRVLFRGTSRLHLRLRHLVVDVSMMKEIGKLSWPPAIQMTVTILSTLAFLRLAGSFGENTQTAYAIGLRLGMIVPMLCFPLASACAILVGQALGAGNVTRAWRAIFSGLVIHGSLMWTFAIVAFFFRTQILDFFTDDPEVIEIGSEYLLYASGAFFLWAFFFVFLRSLQGAGDMLVPMLISVVSTLFFSVPLAYILSQHTDLGRTGLWIAFLASSFVSTVATGIRLASGRWTERAAASPAGGTPNP
ncbi:MAG: MATE family efflux transporter [Deltaproteobacteria bacterium]|nr:MAG: MATE family efflux transporter [Deltaproteobacteria bacterium]TDJ15626.1 MAG: MATE family efflux transporter [Deltaproteobacteria bacterium]